MKALAAATMAGLFGLIFDRDMNPVPLILYTNVLTTTLAFFRLGRSIWALENIISIVTRP
jgi:hypothetical protein